MATKTSKSLKDAQRRYDTLMEENRAMLEEIENGLKDSEVRNPNWGNVGDAGHYHEKLKAIRDQLLHLGEYAE